MRISAVSVFLLHAASICWAASLGSLADPSLEPSYPDTSLTSPIIQTQVETASVNPSSEQPSINKPLLGRQDSSEPSSEVSSSTVTTTIPSDTTVYDDVDEDAPTIPPAQGQIEPGEEGVSESTSTSSTTSPTTDIEDTDDTGLGPDDGVVFIVVSTIEEALEQIIGETDETSDETFEPLQDGVTTSSTPQPLGTTASSPQSESSDEDDSDVNDSDENDSDEDDDDEYDDEDDFDFSNRNKGTPKKGKMTAIKKTIQKSRSENLSTNKFVFKRDAPILSTSGGIDTTGLRDIVSEVSLEKPKFEGDAEGKLIDKPASVNTLTDTPKETINENIHALENVGIYESKLSDRRERDIPERVAEATLADVQLGQDPVTLTLDIGGVDETKLLDTSFKTIDGQRKVIVSIVPELINKPL